jgi:hypothetical protein
MVKVSLRRKFRFLLTGFVAVSSLGAAEEAQKLSGFDSKTAAFAKAADPETPQPATSKPQNAASGPKQEAEKLPLPSGSILVIVKEIGEALQLIPKGVLLTPEKYRAVMERIDQLERQAKPTRPAIPSVCKLSGQVEEELVRFQAQFEFKTDGSKSQVTLGCQRAWLKPGATLDGELPLLIAGEDNQVLVQVDKPGIHHLTLELELPLVAKGLKGTEQGFEFGLPRAAITTLEQLTFPRSIPEVRINGRPVRTRSVENQHCRVEGVALGPADRLEMVWKGPAASIKEGSPILEAEGLMHVRITETTLITDVEFNLQSIWGETKEWRIQLPPQVIPEIKEPRIPDERRIEGIDLPDGKNSILRIRLKEPSADPLKLVFQIRQGRGKTPSPVGLFPVLNAFRQRGTIGVSAQADLRLRYHLRSDVLQREITEKTRREGAVAEFTYGNLPTSPNPAQPAAAPLEILVQDTKGVVEARIEHTLNLTDQGWKTAIKLLITPIRSKIDLVELEVPVGFQFDRAIGVTPAELVESADILDGSGKLTVRLINEQTQPFALNVPGIYPVNREKQLDSLELPKPLKMLDRGGHVTVNLPEGMEFVRQGSGGEEPLPGERLHTWRTDRFPGRIDLAWRPHRPELVVKSEIDVRVADRQVQVRHRMQLQAAEAGTRPVSLLIPAALTDRVRVIQGGALEPGGAVKWTQNAGKDHSLLLSYSFVPTSGETMPASVEGLTPEATAHARRIPVPLVWMTEATRTETKVRIWSDSGTLPVLLDGPWEELGVEVVPDMDTLPGLVLRGDVANAPLILGIPEPPAQAFGAVIIDRGLIQVIIGEEGSQTYRARFLVSRLDSRELDIEFPAPISRLNSELFLAEKRISQWQTLESTNPDKETGTTVRLAVEPLWSRKPVRLEIRYQIPPGLTKCGSGWQTTLQPPHLRNSFSLGQIRWQIELPHTETPIYQRGGQNSEIRWTRSGLLFAPRPAVGTVELEQWLALESSSPTGAAEAAGKIEGTKPGLVCWQSTLQPLVLVHAPQPIWLLACSVMFLAMGLALSLVPRARSQLWLCVVILLLAAGVAGIWWPGTIPAVVFGCEPGLVAGVVILSLQWMLHQRYRRRVVFLPGFTRLKSRSSIVRKEQTNRTGGEPSTVDAPPPRFESSVNPVAGQAQH